MLVSFSHKFRVPFFNLLKSDAIFSIGVLIKRVNALDDACGEQHPHAISHKLKVQGQTRTHELQLFRVTGERQFLTSDVPLAAPADTRT